MVLTDKDGRILIVEDNDMFRRELRSLLDSRFPSMSLDEARDGEQALGKVIAFQPDLIFVDVRLPGENGLQVTEKIRSSGFKGSIIALTSYDLPEYREIAKASGVDCFLVKGSSKPEHIIALVNSILSEPNRLKTNEDQ